MITSKPLKAKYPFVKSLHGLHHIRLATDTAERWNTLLASAAEVSDTIPPLKKKPVLQKVNSGEFFGLVDSEAADVFDGLFTMKDEDEDFSVDFDVALDLPQVSQPSSAAYEANSTSSPMQSIEVADGASNGTVIQSVDNSIGKVEVIEMSAPAGLSRAHTHEPKRKDVSAEAEGRSRGILHDVVVSGLILSLVSCRSRSYS